MATKPVLVLDIAGVLVTNFSQLFWKDLSSKYEIPYANLAKFYKGIKEDLWTGKINEQEFWFRLEKEFPTIEIEYSKLKLHALIKPLPALEEISIWSEYATIHLLSNHRMEWVNQIVEPFQKYIKSMTISSEVGFCKPQVDIYTSAKSHFNRQKRVLFVDDKGEWTKKVVQLL